MDRQVDDAHPPLPEDFNAPKPAESREGRSHASLVERGDHCGDWSAQRPAADRFEASIRRSAQTRPSLSSTFPPDLRLEQRLALARLDGFYDTAPGRGSAPEQPSVEGAWSLHGTKS